MPACHVFWMPKAGNARSEYEDSFWPRQDDFGATSPVLRLAVADGATETSFSGIWARLLVSSYGRGRLTGDAAGDELCKIRRAWRRAVGQKPLPWYAEEKLRSGAFSSLSGLTIFPPGNESAGAGDWQATSIGDSCLFQMRGGDLIHSYPFSQADEFNSRPRLISSLDGGDDPEFVAHTVRGSWQAGDTLFLMTDALACWFLRGMESSEPVSERLNTLQVQSDFELLIDELRSTIDAEGKPVLKNDDVTLLRCVVM